MNNEIFVSQESYAKKVLEKFKIFDCNHVNTPMEGSLKFSKFDSEEKEFPTLFKRLVLNKYKARYYICSWCGVPLYGVSYLYSYEGTLDLTCFTLFLMSSSLWDFVRDVDDRKNK
ncbi:hypothetical protein CR513_30385, partial [Mucuna pruriens]